MTLIHPPALRPGDTVAVISPAGPVIAENLARGVHTLESWGLNVQLHASVFARRAPAGYLAGGDAERLTALREVFLDPRVRAVIASRGGYGTMRLLPALASERKEARDFRAHLRAHPRLFVGFSDITALHLYFAGVLGLATLHAPVVKSFGLHAEDPHESLEHLRAALFGERVGAGMLAIDGLKTVRAGRARGRLLGGNLSLLASLIGSPFCPELNGAIVFLEDIGEEDYRLDRLFTTLRLAEKSARPAGIVLGDFTGCAGAYVEPAEVEAFVEALGAEFDCPVVSGFACGHAHRNLALPVGVQATLDATHGQLILEADAATSVI